MPVQKHSEQDTQNINKKQELIMNKTNLAQKIEHETFAEWEYLATETARVFNLSQK